MSTRPRRRSSSTARASSFTATTAQGTISSTTAARTFAWRRPRTAGPRLLHSSASTLVREIAMCSYIVMKAKLHDSSAKGPKGWMSVDTANVYYDHPAHAPLDHALGIDFVNEAAGGRERVAIELSAESARELIKQIEAALANGEREHAIAIAANQAGAQACEYLT